MYNKFFDIYEENKKLDKLYIDKYGFDSEIQRKNKLELLVELGELANETKCFKYWSLKKPNMDLVIEEYVDSLQMVLCMFNDLNISLDEEFPLEKEFDLIDGFMYLFNLSSKLANDYNKEILKEIFVNLLKLGYLIGFSDEEIILWFKKKIKINIERMETGY